MSRAQLPDYRAAAGLLTAMLCVGLGGCGQRDSRPDGDDLRAAATEASQDESPSLVEEHVLFAPREFASEGVDNPRADGWDTEALSNDASRRLEEFGQLLAGSGEREVEWLDAGFYSNRLVPNPVATHVVFDDELFQVRRLEDRPDEGFDWITTLADFRGYWSRFDNQRFKFKLFGIGIEKGEIWTRQYFHFSGDGPSSVVEQNSTWLVRWRPEGDDQLRLVAIEVEEFEEVVSKRPTPLFADYTHQALNGCETYKSCSLTGIGDWRKRLESRLGVLNFGHHGLAVGDVNGDLRDDLYVCETGGLPNHLYLQQSDGTLRDVTEESGLDYLDNTRSALFVDLDNDGDQDAVVAFAKGVVLLENDGRGQFAERARLNSVREAFSLSAADMDADGLLDVFVCVYFGSDLTASELPAPVPYFNASNGGRNYLVRNLGDWRFADITEETGMEVDNRRFSYASVWEDIDNDGDQDLVVVNDFGPNQLFRNDGGHFAEIAKESGLVDGAFGMSASFADYDHNGNMDLYVANMFSAAGNRVTYQPQFKADADQSARAKIQQLARGNSLFRNVGGRFEDVSIPAGVTMGRWSWGSLFADVNNDGWDDLLVGNGFVTGELPDDL